jgi:hypothetical protein
VVSQGVAYETGKPLPTAQLFNGLSLFAKVLVEESRELASQDRQDAGAYQVELTVRARLPQASRSLEDFSRNDPTLPGVFTDLPGLLSGADVSPFFKKLYELKVAQLEKDLGRLDQILTRHNFYDCETILELEHPLGGRRALLAIADMDVNVDGSYGDRNVTVDGSSQFFLPQTSYRWPKLTGRENPFLAAEEIRLAALKKEMADGGLTTAREREVRDGLDLAKRRIVDLKNWSFLVSETDPFIVLPGFMIRGKSGAFAPGIGDYALVIFGGRAYPAVVGDGGPSLKVGEASLRLCRALNERSSALARPVSDLKVAYLIFPGTADEKPAPPDLEAWRIRCEKYANELGGLNTSIHAWPNLVKPWPTPTPMPMPVATIPPSPPAKPPAMPLVVTPESDGEPRPSQETENR